MSDAITTAAAEHSHAGGEYIHAACLVNDDGFEVELQAHHR
ncbi:hypothetical protein [Brevibacterium sp. p3-SID960]|nr:hypothetical protein [Brevibacterium sp. p3-SID960]